MQLSSNRWQSVLGRAVLSHCGQVWPAHVYWSLASVQTSALSVGVPEFVLHAVAYTNAMTTKRRLILANLVKKSDLRTSLVGVAGCRVCDAQFRSHSRVFLTVNDIMVGIHYYVTF